MTTEDLAKKHLDIDLTTDRFWSEAVKRSLADIDTYIQLANNM